MLLDVHQDHSMDGGDVESKKRRAEEYHDYHSSSEFSVLTAIMHPQH